MQTAAHFKAQLAYGSRRDVRYPPERLAALRSEYRAARLAESIQRSVSESGPFTAEQAQNLTRIITATTTTAQEAGAA